MTVSYSREVAKPSALKFMRLLFRWKGSIYKLLYKELAVYLALYAFLSLIYRFCLDTEGERIFEYMSILAEKYTEIEPITFVLGFYVSFVVSRWWQIFVNVGYMDRAALTVATFVDGEDEEATRAKRTLLRYVALMQILVLREISPPISRRYKKYKDIVNAGYLLDSEMKYLQQGMPSNKFWMPWQWAYSLVRHLRKTNKISADINMGQMLAEIMKFYDYMRTLLNYDLVSVPLVYTQVVIIAVYSYFAASLFSRQYLKPEKGYSGHEVDLYLPVITIAQFFFYMGWLKVAESIMNPLGGEDDDFDLERIVQQNKEISEAIILNSSAIPCMPLDQRSHKQPAPPVPKATPVPLAMPESMQRSEEHVSEEAAMSKHVF